MSLCDGGSELARSRQAFHATNAARVWVYCSIVSADPARAALDSWKRWLRECADPSPDEEAATKALLDSTRAAAYSHLGQATSQRGRWGLRRGSRTCAVIPTLLLARARGELSAADVVRVANHVARCPGCRALDAGMERAEAAFRDPGEAEPPPPMIEATSEVLGLTGSSREDPGQPVYADDSGGMPTRLASPQAKRIDPPAPIVAAASTAVWLPGEMRSTGRGDNADMGLRFGREAWVSTVPEVAATASSSASWVTAQTSTVDLPGAGALPSRDAAEWRSATAESSPASPQDLPRARRRRRLGRTVVIAMLAVLVAAAAAALAVAGVFSGSGKHAATHAAGVIPTPSSSTTDGAAPARRATPRHRRRKGHADRRARTARGTVGGFGATPRPSSLSIPVSIAQSSPTPSTTPQSSIVSPPPASHSAPSRSSTPAPPAGAVGVPTSPQTGRTGPGP